jgi:hypothetical protein
VSRQDARVALQHHSATLLHCVAMTLPVCSAKNVTSSLLPHALVYTINKVTGYEQDHVRPSQITEDHFTHDLMIKHRGIVRAKLSIVRSACTLIIRSADLKKKAAASQVRTQLVNQLFHSADEIVISITI